MKVLIIGLGSIARKHIAALFKINPEVEIVALRSNKEVQSVDNVSNIFSQKEVLANTFDFAIISSPTFKHVEDIEFCLNLKIPLLIEKPLFHTLEINTVLEKAKAIPTYVGCNLRFLECLRFVKNHIHKSEVKVNEVNSYYGSYLPEWRENVDFRKNYSVDPKQGGGVHLDLIHEVDYLYWIFGNPIETSKTFRSNSTLKIKSVDYASYDLVFEKFIAHVQLNYFRRDKKRTLEIVCEEYTLLVDLLKNEVFQNGVSIYKSDKSILDTYHDQMKYFIKNRNSKMMNDLEEAAQILKIAL
jgi:predicted dehydrogenase